MTWRRRAPTNQIKKRLAYAEMVLAPPFSDGVNYSKIIRWYSTFSPFYPYTVLHKIALV